jgi:hypothetical protein
MLRKRDMGSRDRSFGNASGVGQGCSAGQRRITGPAHDLDYKLVDEVIQKVYLDMTSFDRKRAEDVISTVVNRDSNALLMLHTLFGDMRKLTEPNRTFSGAGWRV